MISWGKDGAIDWKGHEGTFWSDRDILYLDLGSDYLGICRSANSLGRTANMCVLHCM